MMRNKKYFLFILALCLQMSDVAAQFSWKALPNAPFNSGRHEDIFFVNPECGWVVSLDGKIFKTADGGKTWIKQYDQFGTKFRSVGFADSLTGWAGTLDNALLYQTKDGGTTWLPVQNIPTPRPGGICGISVVNANVIYASGRYDGPARVMKSVDGGTTWTSIDLEAHAKTLIDCYFWSPDSGIVVGGNGMNVELIMMNAIIVSSFDGGKTWQTRHRTTRVAEWCWKISFPSRHTGYVSIESFQPAGGYCLKTTDGGVTWTEKLVAPRFTGQGIGFVTTTRGWIGGHGRPYETMDGGQSWKQSEDDFFLDNVINRVRALNDTLAYAVGKTVYKYSRDNATTVSSHDEKKIPASYRLEQNFPNPFNPTTTIKYSLARSGSIKLQVLNLSGQVIVTLANETKSAGNYAASFDAANLSSGLYFYRLQAGEMVMTRKMLVTK